MNETFRTVAALVAVHVGADVTESEEYKNLGCVHVLIDNIRYVSGGRPFHFF